MEEYLTVSELTKYISRKFEYDPYLEKVYLKGEISNYNSRRKGKHQYFNIKDEHSIISAVLFAGNSKKVKFDLEEGMSVLISGRVSVYKRGGNYQFIIDSMQPDGIGALFLAYEQTKEKLSKEGLFHPDLKKDIVSYPERIAVVTSPSGAVIQDILTTVERRYPLVEIVLFPTQVQGEKSAHSIVKSIELVEEKGNFDTIIVGRGGGSFEDLFSFNEEKVVRAISKAKTPVISSVGHETDTTLTDLVADLRVATPTAAAELAVPVLTEEIINLENIEKRMIRSFQGQVQLLSKELSELSNSFIFRQPGRLYDGYVQNVDQLEEKLLISFESHLKEKKQNFSLLEQALRTIPIKQRMKEEKKYLNQLKKELIKGISDQLKDKNNQVDQLIQSLEHLSPLKILSRGYSLTRKNDQLISSVEEVNPGDKLEVKLADGELAVETKEIYKKELENDG